MNRNIKRLFFLFPLAAVACAPAEIDPSLQSAAELDPAEELTSRRDDLVDVDQTPSKYQSIGNCWIYATASWAESIHRTATGEEANLSESYWTYWHWFDQIVTGQADDSIKTGGWFRTTVGIIRKYGWTNEAWFVPTEAGQEFSARQKAALATLNAELKMGALRDPAARRDRKRVRQTLDAAWGLSPTVVSTLDAAFGPGVEQTFQTGALAPPTGILTAANLAVAYRKSPGAELSQTTLESAMGDWRESTFNLSGKRAYQKRLQRALHDRLPVMVSWFVDFNALDKTGRFADVPATPGKQGFHMTVLEDYEIDNVPGFGTLAAGTLETRPDALTAALEDAATIKFFRTKNSWGTFRPDRQFIEGFPGYHDLYTQYLHGPVPQCRAKEDGSTDTADCPWNITPLVSGIFPAAY